MNESDDYRAPQAPLDFTADVDPISVGLRTALFFAVPFLFFAAKDLWFAQPNGNPTSSLVIAAMGLACFPSACALAVASLRGWLVLIVTACALALLGCILLVACVNPPDLSHGRLASMLDPGLFGSHMLVILLPAQLVLALIVRHRIAVRGGFRGNGRDARNRKPVDAGFDGWITVDPGKLDRYAKQPPPRPVHYHVELLREIRNDLGSFTQAFTPVAALCFLTLGIVQRDAFEFVIGAILLALYANKLRLLMALLRSGTLRVGTVSELKSRHPKLATCFVSTARIEDGSTIQVLVDESLAAAAERREGELEVGAVCMPKATLAWVIAVRMPRG